MLDIVCYALVGLVIQEGVIHAVQISSRRGNDGLGNLSGLAGVVVVQTDGNLEFEGVGQFRPFGGVSTVNDILVSYHNLSVILENADVLVQVGHQLVIQRFNTVISRGEGTAMGVLGSLGVLDVAVDVAGVDGTINSQDAAHGGIGFKVRLAGGLDVTVNLVAVGQHGDVVVLPVDGTHGIGVLAIRTGCPHLGPDII